MQRPKAPELVVLALAGALLVGALVGLTSSSGGGGGPAAPGEVLIEGFAFGPAAVTVDSGATVTWTNVDRADHTVTQNGKAVLDSPDLATDDTYSVTFAEAGTFEYFCKFHPAMRATITVEG